MRPPVTSDPFLALLGHNRWATHKVLDLCAALSPEQFHQRFDIGPGSLHDTIAHIIGNMRGWADDVAVADGGAPRATPNERKDRYTPAELGRRLDDASDYIGAMIERSRGRMGEHVRVKFRDDGPEFTFTRCVALTHALVHGTHHRAQCLNMLRRLNVPGVSDRLPDIDLNEWQTETECKP
jgi:uncharacterized damage-inducible protein DinB